jgi:hypothetical protein
MTFDKADNQMKELTIEIAVVLDKDSQLSNHSKQL